MKSEGILPPVTLSRARLLLVISAVLWSTSGIFSKVLALPGPTMACYRAVFAGLALLPLLRWNAMRFRWAMVGMVACFSTMNFCFVTAMTLTTAADAIFLQYTAPVWMFLASVFWLKEPFNRKNFIGVLVGLVGIGIIVSGAMGGEKLSGTILALLSGVTYAGVAIFLRILKDEDSIWLTVQNMLGSGILLILALLFVPKGTAYLVVPTAKIGGLIGFGILQVAMPYVLFSRALRTVTPQEAGLITLLEPVLNPIFTFFSVGEVPSRTTLIGGCVIIGGLVFRYGRVVFRKRNLRNH